MAIGTIYLIINKINGHKYIGQTTQGMNKKWKQHIDQAMHMSQHPLHRAMRKHGNYNFMIREICECNENELDEKEKYYIKEYNTFESAKGYNVQDSTSEDNKPIISQETKKELTKEKKWGFNTSENRGNGKHLSTKVMSVNVETGEEKVWNSFTEAAIELTGDKNKTGNIIRAADNGWKAYDHLWRRLEKSKRCIAVYGINKKTWDRTQVFNSIRDAARACGNVKRENQIRKSIRNPRRNSYKGYYWFKA
jgi:group I intron endonuclease